MSDDDRDIDIESDDDNDSDTPNASQRHSQNVSQAEKRAHHNALERKRRDHIKESFSSLREAVPSLKGEKASRAQILKKTTECIQVMRSKNQENRRNVEDLRKQITLLETQINVLEHAKIGYSPDSSDYLLNQSDHTSQHDSSDPEDMESDFSRRSKKMKTSYQA